jgi:small GTP-binding protein
MDWYHAAIEGEIDINEVKVVLVGDGSAGKTTVRKRLMGLPVDPKESQTHGIEIHDHEIECQGRKILAHFWDFGGQEIMHATHQFFLSRRSLYILLLDVRKEEDADYWLKHIESFGGDSPIVVCLNKIDQHPSFEVDRKNLQEKYRGIIDFYRLKCLEEGNAEVKRLIEELPKHIAKAEMSQSKWPRKWSKVKDRLQKDDKPFLEQSEFARICREEKIEEENRQQTLIRFLNDLGIALHFDDRRLKLLQILNPKWATQAVYRIINDPGVAEKRGVLELNRLSAILKRVKPEDFEYPQEKLEYIVDLMKKFEVCHELSGDRVLLPDLLGVQEPNFSFQKRDLLRFRLQYDYLPTSILPRIIVQMHSDTDGDLRWRTGVVLKRKDGRARAVIRSDRHERRISIEVEGVARRDYFAVIRDRFDKIHKDFLKFHVTEQVPLPDHPEVVVDYQDLLFHEEKKRKTILVGEVKSEYDVQDLLNGIEPKEKRQTRKRSPKGGDVNINIEKAYLGDDMSDTFNTEIGDNTSGTIIIGNHINNVIAEKIKNSFNKARDAEDRSNEIRVLLQSLAQEVAKIVVKLPPEKVEEAAEVADHLERITDESVKEKPKKSYWELSKKGIIEAAEAVGKVGETAIKLVSKLGTILGF